MNKDKEKKLENIVTMQKVDIDLLNAIEDALAKNTSKIDALQDVLDFELNRGLKGFHFSIDPFSNASNEQIAADILAMCRAYAIGEYEDVTDKVL